GSGPRGTRYRPGKPTPPRLRGMESTRPKRVAPPESVTPRGPQPLEIREDGPVHGRKTRSRGPETHHGPHGERAKPGGGRPEHRRPDDQGPEEGRRGPRRPSDARGLGRRRAEVGEGRGTRAPSRDGGVRTASS